MVYKSSALRSSRSRFLFVIPLAIVCVFGYFYQQSVDPRKVYGVWVEVDAPPYQSDTLELSSSGVVINNRLVSTSFEFDGKQVTIITGEGATVYVVTGPFDSPRLKRIVPVSPIKQFAKIIM